MGIWDVFTDIADAVKPWSEVEAEAPAAAEEKPEETTSSKDEPAEKEDEEEEEEEEEEEVLDPKERLEKECKNSKQCSPAKHHFDECVERVTNSSSSESEEKEDCVEEFFHLAHCATQCAAPKLWSVLK